MEVTADGTKVFEAPSTDSTLLGTAKKGTQLTMLATNSTWGRVRNKFGETGYILLKNLVYVDPTPTPTVTATPSVAPTDTPRRLRRIRPGSGSDRYAEAGTHAV